jgi:hypothetical protein
VRGGPARCAAPPEAPRDRRPARGTAPPDAPGGRLGRGATGGPRGQRGRGHAARPLSADAPRQRVAPAELGCAGREGVRRPRATTDASGLTHPVSAGAPLLRSRYRSTGRVGRLGTRELRRGAWDCQRGPPCVLPSRAPSPPAHAVLARATHRRQCRLNKGSSCNGHLDERA